MANLVLPHGGELRPRLVKSEELAEARKRAAKLPKVRMTSSETSDLIMIEIGAFSPVDGFMGRKDWEEVCKEFKTAKGIFWPIPITLSVSTDVASGLREGGEVALIDRESGELMSSIKVEEKYAIDKCYEKETLAWEKKGKIPYG